MIKAIKELMKNWKMWKNKVSSTVRVRVRGYDPFKISPFRPSEVEFVVLTLSSYMQWKATQNNTIFFSLFYVAFSKLT